MERVGVIHGRFQPLHLDHEKYLMEAKSRCQFLYVGISNPDPGATRHDEADAERALPEANPYAYHERLLMVTRALMDQGLDRSAFCIVPFPVNFPELLQHYVPLDAVFYMTIYDEWGEKKREMFEKLGVRVEVMWKREDKGITGSQVRELIRTGKDWESLLSPGVAALMKERGLVDRV